LAGSPVSLADTGGTSPTATKISQFSGKPVPRFESLKFSAVHGRIGPSLDHRIAWKYERKGLPVMIIKESRDWRRIRDPDGDEVWVHARMLSSAGTVLVRSEAKLHKAPTETSRPLAALQPGVVASLLECNTGWCRVEAGGQKGWLARPSLWGDAPSETGL